MAIRIKYFASVREYMGRKYDILEVDKPKAILDILSGLEGEGGKLSDLVMEGGKLKRIYKVMVNGRDIEFLDGVQTKIADGDEISIFPPVGGG